MSSGGARLRSGPPADPNALRRDRPSDGEWLVLPVEGRRGPLPEFPLPSATNRELDVWAGLWRKPQAVLWERNGQDLEVALHVRTFVEAEQPEAGAALRNLVRQQLSELLLSIPAMNAARIRFGDAQEGDQAEVVVLARPSARERLRALNDAG
jgi:hypothetical protein